MRRFFRAYRVMCKRLSLTLKVLYIAGPQSTFFTPASAPITSFLFQEGSLIQDTHSLPTPTNNKVNAQAYPASSSPWSIISSLVGNLYETFMFKI